MIIKHLLAHKYFLFFLAFSWTMFIVILCLIDPTKDNIVSFSNADKVAHFSFYFLFVILWNRFLLVSNATILKSKYAILFIAIFFGICIELAQKIFTTTRQADILDVFANTLGAVLGFIISNKFLNNNFNKIP